MLSNPEAFLLLAVLPAWFWSLVYFAVRWALS
jgi:hypothetical protein